MFDFVTNMLGRIFQKKLIAKWLLRWCGHCDFPLRQRSREIGGLLGSGFVRFKNQNPDKAPCQTVPVIVLERASNHHMNTEVVEQGKRGAPIGNGHARKHGLNSLKKAWSQLGNRALDGRSPAAVAIRKWRAELIEDLGAAESVGTQQLAIIDLAGKQKLLLDSTDTWLLSQPSLINARKRSLIPVVLQRQALADSLSQRQRPRDAGNHGLMETTALTDSEAQSVAITSAEPQTCANLVVTTSSGHSERCRNPFCETAIEPMNHGRWRRTQRRFCSDTCKYDYHALKRAKALLDKVGIVRFNYVMERLR
jgi:hypothetical protein